MTIVHAFEASTPFEKLPGTQVTYRGQISIAPAAPPVPHFPRFRALALFGRRPPQRVDSIVMPASENLHITGLMHRSKSELLFDHLVCAAEQADRKSNTKRLGRMNI